MTGNVSPLIVILGPTAVGKTDLSIEMANALDGEIISADSRQVYRYMDVGTAKPTLEQQSAIPHHLIDVVNPDDNLSLAQFQKLAYAAIDETLHRGRIPLLVGGTGQYITAVVEGWSIPEVPPNLSLRSDLETFAGEHGSEALHQRLHQYDPIAAANIDHRNIRRVVRALEVCLETGKPISELQVKHPPPYRIKMVGLTLDRELLYQRADKRVDGMMENGFLDEVRTLLDRGYQRQLPSMSGLGYAQLVAHWLDGLPLSNAIADAKHATHDFIRRQYTWFRGHDSGILWHNRDTMNKTQLVESTSRWIYKQD